MMLQKLKPGLVVRIIEGHESGFGGRQGKIIAVGTFQGGPKHIGALVDINEPLLINIESEGLEEAYDDPLPRGWEEFEV
ncbi:hypothetical protein A3842_02640 [Paenibacillus sp. P3E]|uniref:hypothetical protein n=1 Tax=unclassified Paenibacillus TaxID=185978 RepID=UPI00093AFA08|nr:MULTISPECIES: hypothetical protein [unclassified Paenibacillus]OKP91534.1 hypothetical protein A3842_02640 [Paenibacillus sp. P3E]OKP92493.1 hypothetical protein A3848_08520 [Paenibacillus sp. P32E]